MSTSGFSHRLRLQGSTRTRKVQTPYRSFSHTNPISTPLISFLLPFLNCLRGLLHLSNQGNKFLDHSPFNIQFYTYSISSGVTIPQLKKLVRTFNPLEVYIYTNV